MVLKPSPLHHCRLAFINWIKTTLSYINKVTVIFFQKCMTYANSCLKSILILLIDVYTAFSGFKRFLHTAFCITQRTSHSKWHQSLKIDNVHYIFYHYLMIHSYDVNPFHPVHSQVHLTLAPLETTKGSDIKNWYYCTVFCR